MTSTRVKRIDIVIVIAIFVSLFVALGMVYYRSTEKHGLASYLAYAFPCLAGIAAGAGLYVGRQPRGEVASTPNHSKSTERDDTEGTPPEVGLPPTEVASTHHHIEITERDGTEGKPPGVDPPPADDGGFVELADHAFYKSSIALLLAGMVSFTFTADSCRRPALTVIASLILVALCVVLGTVVTRDKSPQSSESFAIQNGFRIGIAVLTLIYAAVACLLGTHAATALNDFMTC